MSFVEASANFCTPERPDDKKSSLETPEPKPESLGASPTVVGQALRWACTARHSAKPCFILYREPFHGAVLCWRRPEVPSSDQVLGLAAGLKHESAPFDAKGLQSGSRPFPESLAEGAYLLACWRLAARSVCFNVANQVSAEPSK